MAEVVEKEEAELRVRVASLEADMARLRTQNERLESKLQSNQSYTEDLRSQIAKLSQRLGSDKKDQAVQVQLDPPCPTHALPSGSGPEPLEQAWDEARSIAEQVQDVATAVTLKQNMVLEESSGLYYDYTSGYYYDAERQLYYDGTRGIYYKYNYDSQEYEIHSQVDPPQKSSGQSGKRKRAGKATEGDSTSSEEASGEEASEEEGELATSSSGSEAETTDEVIPPCIRIMVLKSETVEVGQLFLVTCMGGTIGREGDHEVLLADIGCSQAHARITYEAFKFYCQDQGSTNGTWINETRLEPEVIREIGHGSKIRIGTTHLACHVHPGIQTCLECEPGLTRVPQTEALLAIETPEQRRRKGMKALKKKYGLSHDNTRPEGERRDPGYQDRAKLRRHKVGVDHPHAKTEVADAKKAIPRKNKGFKMLAQMGWQEGAGLGKGQAGRIEPVQVEQRAERSGLGVNQTYIVAAPTGRSKTKQDILKKTQERFNQIPESYESTRDQSSK